MNETEKTTDNRNVLFAVIFLIVALILLACFGIAYYKHISEKATSTESTANSVATTESASAVSGSTISKGGSYTVTGEHEAIVINTKEDVQLTLQDATIKNDNGPAINVESAGKVTIVLKGKNTITATTTDDLDGAIFSKDDLFFSGDGSLELTSNLDGIVSKDSLTINGGNYEINASDDGIRGKDSVEITDGSFTITAGGDGIKTTNEEETDKGFVVISGGAFTINSNNDGIQATTTATIKAGTFKITTISKRY